MDARPRRHSISRGDCWRVVTRLHERAGTVGGDDRIRLFVALELPGDVSERLTEWAGRHLVSARRVESFHVTLAFLGVRPRSVVDEVAAVMHREALATEPFLLEPVRYRETQSVGMLVLHDSSGRASSLARRVQHGLEALGVYESEPRPWLPHVTVVRFRERPRLDPPLPEIEPFAPSGVAALLSRLHPSGARYEVLESCSLGTGG